VLIDERTAMTGPPFPVRAIDAEWLRRNIKCQSACPVHTSANGYIEAIREGDLAQAYRLARLPNPFAYVCGRVCAHPCETACRRGLIDEPLAIRALKRVATDAHQGDLIAGVLPDKAPDTGRKVAVIGAGPAGLACAHDLALMGHRVTIFEASGVPGGMLRLGVPEYRLPRDVLGMEIDAEMNMETQWNWMYGHGYGSEYGRGYGCGY